MVTTFTTNTLLEFVAITPGGGGGGRTGSGTTTWVSQTSDTMGIFIAILLAIAALSFIVLKAREKMVAYAGNESCASSRKFSKAYWGIGILSAILIIVGGISLTYSQVVANQVSNDGVSAPEKIQAHVDETTGATTFDVSYLKNGAADTATVLGLEVTLAEGVEDGGCTWTVKGFGGKTLYENVAGQEASAFSYDLVAGASENITVATSDMTADVAKSLIGKGVLNLKFTYAITPAPITYNVSFTVNDPSGGSVNPSDTFTVNSGASYKLSASDNSLTFTDGTTTKIIEVKESSGHKFTKWTQNDNPVEAGTSVIITESSVFKAFFDALKELKINGVAKDADGFPIANAAVDIYDEEGNLVTSGTTDSNGNYSLTIPEKYNDMLQAIVKVHSGNNISQDIVISSPGQQQSPITVEEVAVVEPSVNVNGVLLDDKGNVVAGAKVTLTNTYADNNGNLITESFTGYTDENGKYSIVVKANKDYAGTFDKYEAPEIHTTMPGRINVKESDIKVQDTKASATTSTVTFNLEEGSVTNIPEGWTQKNGTSYYKEYNNNSLIAVIKTIWASAAIIPPENKVLTDVTSDVAGQFLTADTTLTPVFENNVLIEGTALDADGNFVSGAAVRFYTEDGKIFKTLTGTNGRYTFNDVPYNTPGTIQIAFENMVSPAYKIGAGGGTFSIPALYLDDKISLKGVVTGSDTKPLKNTEVVATTYTERNGEMVEERYYTKTNEDGSYIINLQQDHKYSISVAIPGTTPPVYISQEKEISDIGENLNINIPKATETALVTIDLNGGSVNKGASGWTKVKAGTYTRTFALGSSYEAITSEWSAAKIKAPSEDKELIGWEPSSGTLSTATTFKPKWSEETDATPKAVYTASDQTLTFYYDSKDYSQDFSNADDVQYDLTEDTKIDFEDLANCVYAPWQDTDKTYHVIPVPKVQPYHIVFDKSFASFSQYPDSDSEANETKPFTSMSAWFMNMPSIQDVEGFEYIYDGITDFSLTFCLFSGVDNTINEISDSNNSNADTKLDLSHFKQSKLTNVFGTFSNSLFSKIVIPGGFAPNAKSFGKSLTITGLGDLYMSLFYGCKANKIEILGKIGTGVTDFTALFYNCRNLSSLEDASVNMIDFSQAQIIDMMFSSTIFASITIPDSLKESTSLTSMWKTFEYAVNLKEIDLRGLKTSLVKNMCCLFKGCESLSSVNMIGLDLSSATDMSSMFYCCYSLSNVGLLKVKSIKAEDMSSMFYNCISLTSVDLSSMNFTAVKNASNMFALDLEHYHSSKLTSISFPRDAKLGFTVLEDSRRMFSLCVCLKTIESVNWTFAANASSEGMFFGNVNLIGGNGLKYPTIAEEQDKTYAQVDTANSPGYFTTNASKTATITYNLNGQEVSSSKNFDYFNYKQVVPIASGSKFTIQGATPLSNPVCTDGTGKQFQCWEYDGTDYKPGDSVAPSSTNIEIKAIWSSKSDESTIEPDEASNSNFAEILQSPFDALTRWFRAILQIA